jgi:2-dehydro-3-deoxy-D-arabinonate dehydratase
MTAALFRVELTDGSRRLARGAVEAGPQRLLPAAVTLDGLLVEGAERFTEVVCDGVGEEADLPAGHRLVAPVEQQEVWSAGVTYLRSRDARMEESETAASVYDAVYEAARPELFFKAPGWRARGHGERIGIRADSSWDVPEPELSLVLDAAGEIAAYTIGNDVSSRSIEGENPLYLPQAKVYDASCAVGPGLVPAGLVRRPFAIETEIERDGAVVFAGDASTAQMKRTPEELAGYLFAALSFPCGAILMTGTTIVPDSSFTLQAGDLVRIAIEGLGALENEVEVVGRSAEAAV